MKKYNVLGNKDTRSGFGDGLLEAGKRNPNVVALCADLTESVKMTAFKEEFPDRFVQVGIAESNMVSIAAGMALSGKVAYIGTFAAFATGRVYDQIRQSVAYSNTNVKICGSHAGITLGEDGATHQILEDIGLMKMIPNMVVINPCDYNQTKQATIAISEHNGPVYLRFGRPKVPIFISEDTPFEIGKAIVLNEGKDVTIIATGHLVWEAIVAGEKLAEQGIDAEIINIHTIKPLDTEAILRSVNKTGCVVSCEEHQYNGGLNDSVSQLLSRNNPKPIEYIGIDDKFGESGKPEDLMVKYGLKSENIISAVHKAIKRK
ncbi:MAG: transketolase family protein [Bacteroidales bacterium]|nr:transketolase family protein [Bacteroidales bacterium]MDD4001392.1 transketolase family protein [Bacteroidales bacterium]MDD4529185.1 transketolase family protein [Bacteroidales bacterium]MDD4829511.1 transketolase family protein [Bacteroidales bacterium]